jgi:hypothetical protein
LTKDSLIKAIEQVAAVKKLVSQRGQMGIYQTDPYIASNLMQTDPVEYLPSFRNPVSCAILGKFINGIENTNINFDYLNSETNELCQNIDFRFYPELIVGGPNNIARTSYIKDATTFPTIFHNINKCKCVYQVIETPNLSLLYASHI